MGNYNAHTNSFSHFCDAADGRPVLAIVNASKGKVDLTLALGYGAQHGDHLGAFLAGLLPSDVLVIADGMRRVVKVMEERKASENVVPLRPKPPSSPLTPAPPEF